MTFDQWLTDTNNEFVKQIHQRLGQFYMNTLHSSRPDLHNKIINTNYDPFYNDLMLDAFLPFLRENW